MKCLKSEKDIEKKSRDRGIEINMNNMRGTPTDNMESVGVYDRRDDLEHKTTNCNQQHIKINNMGSIEIFEQHSVCGNEDGVHRNDMDSRRKRIL